VSAGGRRRRKIRIGDRRVRQETTGRCAGGRWRPEALETRRRGSEGTITAADVGALAAGQGIAAGEFDEFVGAIRAGATYVNVYSVGRPTGEIRAQLEEDDD
jgi:hypothetical protein